MSLPTHCFRRTLCFFTYVGLVLLAPLYAQDVVGAITGTVKDSTGAAMPDTTVKVQNVGTNLAIVAHTGANGSFVVPNLPAGGYTVTFTKEGFQTETHTQVLVNANRTTTVDGNLQVGTVATTVEVTSTPLMNQVDTTNGYVVDQLTIQETPLGTGSFTQLAILTPGVHADMLGGAGSNSGLGNQAIFANGNRDTSNSFSLNGVDTNNLFNGNSTSQVGENRFVLNIGENFGAGGAIQTSTSVYGAIGQALPTPPPEAIQEVAVNAAMYDATQGAHSGAHISVVTKSGTNELHGMVYDEFQNSAMNAAPFFYNASPAILVKDPFLNRNQFGANLGGPIKKNKMFYFLAYQGVRLADASDATKEVSVPIGLTDDRSAQGIANAVKTSYGNSIATSQISPVALNLLQAKLPNGQYLFPSAQITDSATALRLGYDAVVQGANAKSSVDQAIGNIDYSLSDMDRLSVKYYYQRDPTTNPFGAVGGLLGFAQQLQAGSQVGTLTNTTVLTPNVTWQQHVGFTRLLAYAQTGQDFSPSSLGMNLLGASDFPQIQITNVLGSDGLEFGPSVSFGNAGMYQNQTELGSSLNWVKGRHTISIGANWDLAQLNIVNNNTSTDTLGFKGFLNFVEGNVRTGSYSAAFSGSASRYYRSDTAGAYINDNIKVLSNLTLTAGLRWDFDGPLSEKYGKLTAFDPSLYSYDASSDTITNSGLEVAGNNKLLGTAGASDTLLNQHQWGFAPRVGLAWTPKSKLTVRTGFGMYYDRGELFSEFSPSAGFGFNGPLGVTLAQPFVTAIFATKGATLATPFGTSAFPPPPSTPEAFTALLPNLSQTLSGHYPTGNLFGPFLIGGYDINNKLPYTLNWTFDIQYQASNNWLFSVGYVGNHGVHEVLPIPFNQPLIATAQNPVNGQTYSYGGITPEDLYLNLEPYDPAPEYAGNAPARVPYMGYDMNSVSYRAVGISNYNALQLQARKRLSNGLQFTASYTWSHALDEQSGLGLFFTGNNPLDPRSNYASSDFDQTHVFLINFSYTLPSLTSNHSLGYFVNGWTLGGQVVAQSGQPYSIYDFSGSVASLYYGSSDYITNPIVSLVPGVSSKQAQLQGTLGANAGQPVLNAADFGPQFVAPGTYGVPPCDSSGCDQYESLYGNSGRNLFRAPFQSRFDFSLGKEFALTERYRLRFNFDAFNIFNHPDFDAPNNDVVFFPYYTGPPSIPPQGSLGYIQHTVGSPRFLQLSLHLTF
ncbi:MAG TPA: TonB-dependent receptor [Bryobacteraceae bacterium]|nr:TonB-dependent receptor [Bryobacteraceae bacterium]